MVSAIEWLSFHLVFSIFWLWILCWGGAQRLEGTLGAGLLISILALRWSAEGIRLFALVTLILGTIFFSIGYFFPSVRCLVVSSC